MTRQSSTRTSAHHLLSGTVAAVRFALTERSDGMRERERESDRMSRRQIRDGKRLIAERGDETYGGDKMVMESKKD